MGWHEVSQTGCQRREVHPAANKNKIHKQNCLWVCSVELSSFAAITVVLKGL